VSKISSDIRLCLLWGNPILEAFDSLQLDELHHDGTHHSAEYDDWIARFFGASGFIKTSVAQTWTIPTALRSLPRFAGRSAG